MPWDLDVWRWCTTDILRGTGTRVGIVKREYDEPRACGILKILTVEKCGMVSVKVRVFGI